METGGKKIVDGLPASRANSFKGNDNRLFHNKYETKAISENKIR